MAASEPLPWAMPRSSTRGAGGWRVCAQMVPVNGVWEPSQARQPQAGTWP